MFTLPENARLGTTWADVSFYVGADAERALADLDKAWFREGWVSTGFVNAMFTEEALLDLFGRLDPLDLTPPQELFSNLGMRREEEIFAPAMRDYGVLFPHRIKEAVYDCPVFEGERRTLLLQLIAAGLGGCAPLFERSLTKGIMGQMHTEFIFWPDPALAMLCTAGLVLLQNRLTERPAN